MTTTPSPEALATPEMIQAGYRIVERNRGPVSYHDCKLIIEAALRARPTPTDSGEVVQGDREDIHELVRSALQRFGYWQFEMVLGGDGGFEADWRTKEGYHRLAFSRPEPVDAGKPVAMLLYCPECHLQHIDEPDDLTPDWTNPPHRSHLCHGCGCIWRPADVATNGVASIATVGKADTWTPLNTPPHLPPAEPVGDWSSGVNYGLQVAYLAARGTNSDLCKSASAAYRNILACLKKMTAGNIPDCYRPGPAPPSAPVGGEALVERVAQAIADAQHGAPFNGFDWPEAWAHFETLARAAIQAIPAPATDAGQSADSLVEALARAAQIAGDAFWNLPVPKHWDRDRQEYIDWCARQSKFVREQIASLPKSPSAGEEA